MFLALGLAARRHPSGLSSLMSCPMPTWKSLIVWSRSSRVGILETSVDLLADEDPVHNLVPRALVRKLFGQFQDGVFDLSHRWTVLIN